MNNTDKLLSDIANDMVLVYLQEGIHPDYVYMSPVVEEFSDTIQDELYDKASTIINELATFFERTIK